MPVFAKKVQTTDKRFAGRKIELFSPNHTIPRTGLNLLCDGIPVPDTVVLCNGCNENIYPEVGYLVYLGRCEFNNDQPYDLYCEGCLKKYFPNYKEVI